MAVHMLTPTYEENLQAFSAPAAVAQPEGAAIDSKRPMYVVLGLVLFLVIVAVLYNMAGRG